MTTKKTTTNKVATKAATTKVAKPTIKSLQADVSELQSVIVAKDNLLIEREAEIIVLREGIEDYQYQIEKWRASYNDLYKELQELRTRNWYQRLFNIKGA